MTHIGNTRSLTDVLDPARAAALHATLDLAGPAPEAGSPLPPFWHYIYFWEAEPPAGLGRDGHPRTGGFIPNLGLPRRMWAGGSLVFEAPLRIGSEAEKVSRIADVVRKEARSGPLAIVTLEHEIRQGGRRCVWERQSLIYREDAQPGAIAPEPPPAPQDTAIRQSRRFSATDLFRYSALTFNGHRIHYDREYSKGTEGYDGLIVHGPLLAQMLVHLAVSVLGGLQRFEFRATAPLFDHEEATFCARHEAEGLQLWVRGPDGRQCMQATAG